MNRLSLIYGLLRTQGPGWVVYRLCNTIAHNLGVLERRLPISTWDEVSVDLSLCDNWQSCCGRFLFSPRDRPSYAPVLRGFDDGSIDWSKRVELIASGRIGYFSNVPVDVGFPPKWTDNSLQSIPGPAMIHFSKINEFGCGDIKCI